MRSVNYIFKNNFRASAIAAANVNPAKPELPIDFLKRTAGNCYPAGMKIGETQLSNLKSKVTSLSITRMAEKRPTACSKLRKRERPVDLPSSVNTIIFLFVLTG